MLSQTNGEAQTRHLSDLSQTIATGNEMRAKQVVDEMSLKLRDVLQQTSDVELIWNAIAPRAMATT